MTKASTTMPSPTMPNPNEQLAAPPVRVIIVDDHELVRDGIRLLVDSVAPLKVCGEAADAAAGRALIRKVRPHVVVVDITLKDDNGLDLIKWVKKHYPQIHAIVLTMHDEKIYGERALRAGASGYVNKQDAARAILTAIREVVDGKLYFSEAFTHRFMHRAVGGKGNEQATSAVDALSDRELDVFRLIGQGKTSRQIAVMLRLASSTVETYRERLKTKLNLTNSAELAQHATLWVTDNL
ncbi:MAG: response regulator transcription factor [Planctomycetia bacterium]|nr:response regulator transcription factor [Planctomycetia bacterium]